MGINKLDKKQCSNCGSENPAYAKYCSICGHEIPVESIIEPQVWPIPRKKNKLVPIIGIALGIIVFTGIIYTVRHFNFKTLLIDKQMMMAAEEINKSCPIMVDAETRLDNAVALPGNIFQYNYTLVNYGIEGLDPVELKKFMEPVITNNVSTNPQMQYQRDKKTTVNYYYKDKDGVFLFEISVGPDKYSKVNTIENEGVGL